jgi:hypothetical protein
MDLPEGVPLAGYTGRMVFPDILGLHEYTHYFPPSDGVRDPVRAKALLLQRAGQELLFLSLDVVGISWEIRQEILEAIQGIGPGIASDELFVSATHTHSGPGAISRNGLIEFTAADRFHPEIHAIFLTAVKQAVQQAAADLGPAKLFAYEFKAVGLQQNRNDKRDDPEYFDDVANVLLVREPAANGKWRAAMVNLAIHATALGDDNKKLSGDIPGEIERKFGEVLQDSTMPDPVPVLFINGAEGDVKPSYGNDGGVVYIGAAFAAQAGAALPTAAPVTPASWEVRTTAAPVDIKTPFYYFAARSAFIKLWPWNRFGMSAGHWMPYRVRIWSIRLGGLRMMTWPGEPTTSIGLALRKRAIESGAKHAWVLGLTNGHAAYFANCSDYFDFDDYSAAGSLYGPHGGNKLLNEHTCLLQ